MFDEAILNDARMAQRLVPIGEQKKVTPSQEHAAVAFPNLMLGIPVPQPPGLNLPDQIETLLGMLAGVITQLGPNTNLQGIQTVADFIDGLIQQLAQDESQSARVNAYADNLKKLMMDAVKRVKAMQEANNGQPDPETLAKVRGIEMTTRAKVQGMRETTAAKLNSKAQSDQMKLSTKKITDGQKLEQKEMSHAQDIAHADAAVAQELNHEELKTANEIARENAKAEAEKERIKNEPKTSAKE
jgi:hypothetical protein